MTDLETFMDRFAEGSFDAADVVELGARMAADVDTRATFDRAMNAQRSADAVLDHAVDAAARSALGIVPSRLAPSRFTPSTDKVLGARTTIRSRIRPLSGLLSGWAAAAVLAVLLAGSLLIHREDAGEVARAPETLLAEYLREGAAHGRIVGELPTVTLSVSPAAEGGFDVVFVRRLLERTTVEDVYRLGLDEHGRPAIVQADAPAGAARESL